MGKPRKLKVGDRIRFRAVTRWTDQPAIRIIRDFDHVGRPLVRFGGWSHFIVQHHEILERIEA